MRPFRDGTSQKGTRISAFFQGGGNPTMAAPSLTLRLYTSSIDSEQPVAITYEVVGLPSGHEARISSVPPHEWRILRIRRGQTVGWYGNYPTMEAALASLQADLDEEHRQRESKRDGRRATRDLPPQSSE
jgi:hypothetical protein